MLLQWILALLVLIPCFLFLSVILPQTQWFFMMLWLISLTADLYSTHKFYRENPAQFSQNERNKAFTLLTKKLSFKKASVIFPLSFEIPLLLFFALLLMKILYAYMFQGTPINIPACLATSFGVAGIGHMQAASTNLRFTKKKIENTTVE